MSEMKVIVVSPEKTLYSGDAERVEVPGTKGRFEVLRHHAPIVSSLTEGVVKVNGETPAEFAIKGGFVEVSADCVNVCVEERI